MGKIMSKIVLFITTFLLIINFTNYAKASEQSVLKIYLDADRSNHIESAYSIEMGLRTAFSELGNEIQGHKVVFVPMDHKGNSVRSKRNMMAFKDDHQALVIFAGMHSPPLIKYRKYINENEILTLVPWAAGGPITRFPDKHNWVFRLSIDDTKAGYRMAGFAIEKKKCKSPHLLLEKTPWGKSNEKSMKFALKKLSGYTPDVTWFNWNTKEHVAKIKLRKAIKRGADCLLFVGNAIEGAAFSKAMVSLDHKVPIISHWGITGGSFHNVIDKELREKFDLTFIQSCFSFVSSKPTALSQKVLAKAQKLYPQIKAGKDIPAPTGFIHAYDLGKLTIEAIKSIKLGQDMKENRKKLRTALESLKSPVQGLIKKYEAPFEEFSKENLDAHEALGLEDFCMAKYGSENQVTILNN